MCVIGYEPRSCDLRSYGHSWEYVEVGIFEGNGSISVNISGGRRPSPATVVGVKKLQRFLSYDVDILTDGYFVLSQHAFDRRTGGWLSMV